MSGLKIIYDIGANNGDNIPYYLLKSDIVIAIEANPELIDCINSRFQDQIKAGRLIVYGCVLTVNKECDEVEFFIHKYNNMLSQLTRPIDVENYTSVLLPSKNILQIIHENGDPFYIKIDIEYYDYEILKYLFASNVTPPFISAEAHDLKIFEIMLSGGYKSFNLVNGNTVDIEFSDAVVACGSNKVKYKFPRHSAGPFGEDLRKPWLPPRMFSKLMMIEGYGWKDIHATKLIKPNFSHKISSRAYIISLVVTHFQKKLTRLKEKIRLYPQLFQIIKNIKLKLQNIFDN